MLLWVRRSLRILLCFLIEWVIGWNMLICGEMCIRVLSVLRVIVDLLVWFLVEVM